MFARACGGKVDGRGEGGAGGCQEGPVGGASVPTAGLGDEGQGSLLHGALDHPVGLRRARATQQRAGQEQVGVTAVRRQELVARGGHAL